jgi:thiol-disulfide isomerase/thioredoxin
MSNYSVLPIIALIILAIGLGYLIHKHRQYLLGFYTSEEQMEGFLESRVPSNTEQMLTIYKVEWCPHCRALKPVIGRLEAKLKAQPIRGSLLEVVDCEKDPQACREAKVQSYPTILHWKKDSPAVPLPATVDRNDSEALYRYLANNSRS